MASDKRPPKRQSKRMAYLRAKLLEQRRRLLYALDRRVSAPAGAPSGVGDAYDAASDSSEKETCYGIAELETDSLNEVDRALRKIDEGTYGLCERCGARIPAGRLRVMPFASFCIKCKEEMELRRGFDRSAEVAWSRVTLDPEQSGDPDQVIETVNRGE